MVRGKPTIEQALPEFIEFLGAPHTLPLAYHALCDLSFLPMAHTRLRITFPPHDLFDTLDMAHLLYPIWPSSRLAHAAINLNVSNGAEHRALSDARLVSNVDLAMLTRTSTARSMADLVPLSPSLTAAEVPFTFSLPQGRCAAHPCGPLE
jgi:DNA polymerase III epsilon subunit-like protein